MSLDVQEKVLVMMFMLAGVFSQMNIDSTDSSWSLNLHNFDVSLFSLPHLHIYTLLFPSQEIDPFFFLTLNSILKCSTPYLSVTALDLFVFFYF